MISIFVTIQVRPGFREQFAEASLVWIARRTVKPEVLP